MMTKATVILFLTICMLEDAFPKSHSAANTRDENSDETPLRRLYAIAYRHCNAVLSRADKVTAKKGEENAAECCQSAVMSNRPVTSCAGIHFSRAIEIVFAVNRELHGEGNRRIADFACCFTVYASGITERADDRCYNVCRDAFYTAGYSQQHLLSLVSACKPWNPGFACFKKCIDEPQPLTYSSEEADACLLLASPESSDGIPIGDVPDKK